MVDTNSESKVAAVSHIGAAQRGNAEVTSVGGSNHAHTMVDVNSESKVAAASNIGADQSDGKKQVVQAFHLA
eukprot:1905613-Karenia_brevis.AAC.1